MTEFVAFGKIPRLNRQMCITEKIDGTNACVIVEEAPSFYNHGQISVTAQSRKKIVTPEDDNYGFAAWVRENADSLAQDLGPGRHFGEWWGNGIQRGYNQKYKNFSLFNVKKWRDANFVTVGLRVVPVLHEGLFNTNQIELELARLRYGGSVAAPGFSRPEGLVVFHTAAGGYFKVTLEKDEVPKGLAHEFI